MSDFNVERAIPINGKDEREPAFDIENARIFTGMEDSTAGIDFPDVPTDKTYTFDKRKIALAEVSGNMEHKDFAQVENIVLRDLKSIGKLDKNITLDQVRNDPELYNDVVQKYWNRLDAFHIPEDQKALWWLMPGRYQKAGGDIEKIEGRTPEETQRFRNIMRNRKKNIETGEKK